MMQTPPTRSPSHPRWRRSAGLAALVAVVVAVAVAVAMIPRGAQRPAAAIPLPEPVLPQFDGADPLVAQAIQQAADKVRQAPQSSDTWGRLGMALMAHNYDDTALAAFEQAERMAPAEVRWPYYAGIIAGAKSPKAGIANLQRASDVAGDDHPSVHLRLAEALFDDGQLDTAAALYNRVIAKLPGNSRALTGLGQVAMAQGELGKAKEYFERALSLGGSSRPIHSGLALIYQREGDAARAERHLQQAASLPDRPQYNDPLLVPVQQAWTGEAAMIARAEQLRAAGQMDLASKLAGAIVKDYPTSYRGWWSLGMTEQARGNFPASDAAFEQARKLKPDMVEVKLAHSYTLMLMGQLDKAAALTDEVLGKQPQSADAHLSKAMILHEKQDFTGAVEAAKRSLQIRPDYRPAQIALAKALLGAGKKEDATRMAQDVLAKNHQDKEAAQILAEAAK